MNNWFFLRNIMTNNVNKGKEENNVNKEKYSKKNNKK